MTVVMTNNDVKIKEDNYSYTPKPKTIDKTRRLNSGNDFSYGDARNEDTRELERNPKKNNVSTSFFASLFYFLTRKNKKVIDKKTVRVTNNAKYN